MNHPQSTQTSQTSAPRGKSGPTGSRSRPPSDPPPVHWNLIETRKKSKRELTIIEVGEGEDVKYFVQGDNGDKVWVDWWGHPLDYSKPGKVEKEGVTEIEPRTKTLADLSFKKKDSAKSRQAKAEEQEGPDNDDSELSPEEEAKLKKELLAPKKSTGGASPKQPSESTAPRSPLPVKKPPSQLNSSSTSTASAVHPQSPARSESMKKKLSTEVAGPSRKKEGGVRVKGGAIVSDEDDEDTAIQEDYDPPTDEPMNMDPSQSVFVKQSSSVKRVAVPTSTSTTQPASQRQQSPSHSEQAQALPEHSSTSPLSHSNLPPQPPPSALTQIATQPQPHTETTASSKLGAASKSDQVSESIPAFPSNPASPSAASSPLSELADSSPVKSDVEASYSQPMQMDTSEDGRSHGVSQPNLGSAKETKSRSEKGRSSNNHSLESTHTPQTEADPSLSRTSSSTSERKLKSKKSETGKRKATVPSSEDDSSEDSAPPRLKKTGRVRKNSLKGSDSGVDEKTGGSGDISRTTSVHDKMNVDGRLSAERHDSHLSTKAKRLTESETKKRKAQDSQSFQSVDERSKKPKTTPDPTKTFGLASSSTPDDKKHHAESPVLKAKAKDRASESEISFKMKEKSEAKDEPLPGGSKRTVIPQRLNPSSSAASTPSSKSGSPDARKAVNVPAKKSTTMTPSIPAKVGAKATPSSTPSGVNYLDALLGRSKPSQDNPSIKFNKDEQKLKQAADIEKMRDDYMANINKELATTFDYERDRNVFKAFERWNMTTTWDGPAVYPHCDGRAWAFGPEIRAQVAAEIEMADEVTP